MKFRKFNSMINACRNKEKTLLDINKIPLLKREIKNEIVHYLVRNRGPIVKEFITSDIDKNWLECCGYLCETKGKDFTFVHKSEHTII